MNNMVADNSEYSFKFICEKLNIDINILSTTQKRYLRLFNIVHLVDLLETSSLSDETKYKRICHFLKVPAILQGNTLITAAKILVKHSHLNEQGLFLQLSKELNSNFHPGKHFLYTPVSCNGLSFFELAFLIAVIFKTISGIRLNKIK